MKNLKARLTGLLLFLMLAIAMNTNAQTVYVTRTGAKYHADYCRYLKQSKYSINLSEAVEQGYTACSVCRPSSTVTNASSGTTNAVELDTDTTLAAPSYSTTTYEPPVQESTTSVQCSGTTKAGNRCKRMTTASSGRCYQH
jgi:hypothetical protein